MNQASMFVGRPIVAINQGAGEPFIGFCVSLRDDNTSFLVVHDYVTNTHVEVHASRAFVFTQQRFNALFLMDKSSLFSLFFTPLREITFKEREWNEAYVRCQLEINEFWPRYQQYLKGERINESE